MDLEALLRLFDSCWYNPTPSPNSQETPHNKIQESSPKDSSNLELKVGSQSDDLSYDSDSFSPDSVLPSIHPTPFCNKIELKKVKGRRRRRRRISKIGEGKSLSELEREELKGFLDLGFEFSEEDVNSSSLVEIIPGLCKNRDRTNPRARPYLSEAWQVVERKKTMDSLMNWKIPDMTYEVDIKHSLKCWAHTVASTVKA